MRDMRVECGGRGLGGYRELMRAGCRGWVAYREREVHHRALLTLLGAEGACQKRGAMV